MAAFVRVKGIKDRRYFFEAEWNRDKTPLRRTAQRLILY